MEIVKFADIVKRVNTKEDRFNTDKIYYVGGDHIDSNELKVRQRGIIKGSTIGPMFYCGFKAGDILFVTRNPHLRKCAVVDFDGICSEKTFVLATKDSSRLLQEYLALVMQSDDFWTYCDENKSGGVNYFLNWSSLADYEFPLPSIDEQKVLANKLWAAYRVKESYRQLLTATDDMVKAKFQEMFGEADCLVSLESVCETFKDGDWIESKDQADSGIRLIQTGNVGYGFYKDKGEKAKYISEETFKRLNCTEIFPGDILISRLPDPIGRACILPDGLGRTITAVDCTIIRLKDCMLPNVFIANTLSDNYAQQINSFVLGTTRMRISRNNLATIKLLCPGIEEQKIFNAIFNQAEATKASLRESIASIDRVIRSLINQ